MIAPPKPPSHDELEALIKEARERQLRRRLLGAAGVAIAAAVGLGVYALMGGNSDSSLALPAEGGRAGAPLCLSAQLSATVGFQASTQMFVGGAEITNTGDSPCALPRVWPRVRLTTQGKPYDVAQTREVTPVYGAQTRVLSPGVRTFVPMQWGNGCGTPHMAPSHGGEALVLREIDFALDFGAGVVVTAAERGTPPCLGPGASTLVVYSPQASS